MNSEQHCNYSFETGIRTNYSGYNQLTKLYHFCLGQPVGSKILIDFSNVDFFDGNLCALFMAMIFKLNKDHRHTFTTDEQAIKERFDVLFRNGFIKTQTPVVDNRKSTIPIQFFDCSDKEGFCNYIEKELLSHRGMPALEPELRDRINDDLLEVFCNSHYHANTIDPFFVGGQYYPKNGYLKFTMVDLGDGFLPRISKATNDGITSNLGAILWALEGNSSKKILDDCPGGLGITSMYKYIKNQGGILQIVSNDGFWSSDFENTIFANGRTLQTPFHGTTINLIFEKK